MNTQLNKVRRRNFLGTLLAAPLALVMGGRSDAAKPTAKQPIPLCCCLIAGFQYHQGPDILPQLTVGQKLVLQREPENPYDHLAVAVHTSAGRKLGYLPRHLNEIPAALMDNGRQLTAGITALSRNAPPWEMVELEIRLG
jgi:hypothetical protein